MNRRDLITAAAGAAGAAAFMAAAPAFAGDEHAAHKAGAKPNMKLVDAAATCSKASEVCLAHCLTTFTTGDTSLSACAVVVNETIALCNALTRLAAAGSMHLADQAKVALAVCDHCEKECRKHADHHEVCKACADACVACIAECKKAAA